MIRFHLITLTLVLCIGTASVQAQEKILGRSAESWATQLKSSGDAKERRSAAFVLGKLGSRASALVADMKNAYAKEKDAKVREAIVFGLAEVCRDNVSINTDPELEKLFLGAIADGDPHIRRSAAFALGCLASKSAATKQALESAVTDKEPMVRQNAAWALGQFEEAAIPALRKALRDEDSFVKRDAAGALGKMGDGDKVHEILKDFLPLCEDKNSEVRRVALNILVKIVDPKDKEAIPVLTAALEDRDMENRRNAALALTNIGGEKAASALPVLLEAAKNGDKDLRRQAVVGIRNLKKWGAPAVPELSRYLQEDKDAKMREYAAVALGGIGSPAEPAIPLLVQKVQDIGEDKAVRTESAMALSNIGAVPGAVKFIPNLLEVIGDVKADALVRERVMWALRVHGGDLRTLNGPKDTFVRILKEPLNGGNRMLRYDCAYMLGMIWQAEAPEQTLDIISDFLRDDTIKVFDKLSTKVESTKEEGQIGKASVDLQGKGDGRVMAADALIMMGPSRFVGRADIMKQLRVLAADAKLYDPLRKKVNELLKSAQ